MSKLSDKKLTIADLKNVKDFTPAQKEQVTNFAKSISKLVDGIQSPAKIMANLYQDPLKNIDMSWVADESRRKAEEARLRRLQLEKLEREMAIDMTLPTYDIVDCLISFRGKKIQIPPDTDQEMLCKVVLRNKNAMSRRWNWDEIIEAWGDVPEKDDWRKVYNAGRGINEQVEKKTTISNFLIVKTKTLQLNPDFLQ
ncbi:MAG: hypothetical protein WC220_00135 [Pedobacter sp.]|jgi:hypothetical protein